MVQLRQTTARLRLFLAEIEAREEQLDSMVSQFPRPACQASQAGCL